MSTSIISITTKSTPTSTSIVLTFAISYVLLPILKALLDYVSLPKTAEQNQKQIIKFLHYLHRHHLDYLHLHYLHRRRRHLNQQRKQIWRFSPISRNFHKFLQHKSLNSKENITKLYWFLVFI